MIDVVLLTAPPPLGAVTGGQRYNEAIAERAGHHDARMRAVAISGRTLAQRALAARRALHQSNGVDAIVIDSIVADAAALAGRGNVPLVGLAHQIPSARHPTVFGALGRALSRTAYRRCRRLIAVSEWVAAALDSIGVPCAVVPPGVERPPAREATNAGGPPIVLCVANWLAHKGILDLAEAMALLPAEAGRLRLVGAPRLETSYGRRVAARIGRSDLRDRVTARGTLGRDDVDHELARADIFALPSRDEAYCIAVAEALANGLPVVGYRSGNVTDLVGGAGILVDPGDVSGLAESLRLLTLDRDRRRSFAELARRRAATLSTWDQSARAFFEAIRSGMRLASAAERHERDRTPSSA